MKRFLLLSLSLLMGLQLWAQQYVPTEENLQARKTFQDEKFGIFLHWGVYSMLADGEWVMHTRKINRDEYAQLPAGFYPSRFNAQEWVDAFKAAGAKYITFTTRHHDGFSMFGTKASPYNIVDATPFHRDILKELADACQQAGIKLHLYYSHMDWYRTDYPLGNSSKELPHDEATTNWPKYYKFMNSQLTELLTQYGKIGAIWFDGVWDHAENFDWQLPEQYALIHRLQPACLIINNHHQDPYPGEDAQAFEQDLPGQNKAGFSGKANISKLPLESCQTMNNTWGYNITDKAYKSSDEIIRRLVTSAGMNSNLLLNIGPRPDGRLPKEALERLRDIGQFMSQYGETIYGTRGGIIAPQEWGVSTQKGNTLYVHILKLNDKTLQLPLKAKVKSAVCFKDNTKLKLKRNKQGYQLTLNEVPTDIDYVVKITLK
ncbi:MAG: alpha-L-fucosidase [Prevotella sp.]|jgi:alpha-L-fucosidase